MFEQDSGVSGFGCRIVQTSLSRVADVAQHQGNWLRSCGDAALQPYGLSQCEVLRTYSLLLAYESAASTCRDNRSSHV